MKTVTIEGKEYEVPDKARWVSTDLCGETYWYMTKPKIDNLNCEFSISFFDFDFGLICNLGITKDWRNTLRKI